MPNKLESFGLSPIENDLKLGSPIAQYFSCAIGAKI